MEDCTYRNGLLQEALMNFDPVNIDTSPVEKAGFMLEKPQKLGQTLPPRASAHASYSTKKTFLVITSTIEMILQNLVLNCKTWIFYSPSSISYLVEGYGDILELDVVTSRPKLFVKLPFFVGTECHDSLVSYKNNPTIHCINTSDFSSFFESRG